MHYLSKIATFKKEMLHMEHLGHIYLMINNVYLKIYVNLVIIICDIMISYHTDALYTLHSLDTCSIARLD